jgi:hypothetical protein
MNFRFFKALPEPQASVQLPTSPADGEEMAFVVLALERTNDPDANNHTGFDFFGAYGDAGAIDTWAAGQPVTTITKSQLPNPITFYPDPFNEA